MTKPLVRALFVVLLVAACGGSPAATSTSTAVSAPPVDVALDTAEAGGPIAMTGLVSELGELFCPCFRLTAGGATAIIWYDLTPAHGSSGPVSVTGIANGDQIEVTGTLTDEPDPGSGLPVVWATGLARVE